MPSPKKGTGRFYFDDTAATFNKLQCAYQKNLTAASERRAYRSAS